MSTTLWILFCVSVCLVLAFDLFVWRLGEATLSNQLRDGGAPYAYAAGVVVGHIWLSDPLGPWWLFWLLFTGVGAALVVLRRERVPHWAGLIAGVMIGTQWAN